MRNRNKIFSQDHRLCQCSSCKGFAHAKPGTIHRKCGYSVGAQTRKEQGKPLVQKSLRGTWNAASQDQL